MIRECGDCSIMRRYRSQVLCEQCHGVIVCVIERIVGVGSLMTIPADARATRIGLMSISVYMHSHILFADGACLAKDKEKESESVLPALRGRSDARY